MYPAWMERTERSQLKARGPREARARTRLGAERLVVEDARDALGDRLLRCTGRRAERASPTTSGSDEMREVTTGVPQAMASSGGQAEALVEGREGEHRGHAVEGGQGAVRARSRRSARPGARPASSTVRRSEP